MCVPACNIGRVSSSLPYGPSPAACGALDCLLARPLCCLWVVLPWVSKHSTHTHAYKQNSHHCTQARNGGAGGCWPGEGDRCEQLQCGAGAALLALYSQVMAGCTVTVTLPYGAGVLQFGMWSVWRCQLCEGGHFGRTAHQRITGARARIIVCLKEWFVRRKSAACHCPLTAMQLPSLQAARHLLSSSSHLLALPITLVSPRLRRC